MGGINPAPFFRGVLILYRIGVRLTHSAKMDKHHSQSRLWGVERGWINLVILVFIVFVVAATSGFLLWKNNVRPQETNLPIQQNTIQPTNMPNNTNNLCSQFQPVQGEIKCEDAIQIAIEKYSGEVQEIEEGSGFRLVNSKNKGKNVWIVGVKLKESQENQKLLVFIDKADGKELYSRHTPAK